jgi:hypothetical protein
MKLPSNRHKKRDEKKEGRQQHAHALKTAAGSTAGQAKSSTQNKPAKKQAAFFLRVSGQRGCVVSMCGVLYILCCALYATCHSRHLSRLVHT